MGRTKKAARKFNSVARKKFPEEPLYLTPSKGGGFYPARIHQNLDDGKYKIVRKLGYGPRSSTWLVSHTQAHEPGHFAVKIFTVAASERAKDVELPIMEEVDKVSRLGSLELPTFYSSFFVETSMGRHLCFVMNPLSTSVWDLQQDANYQRLPVHVVQRIVWSVSNSLNGLHGVKIMHGRTFLIHDLFHPGTIANPLLEIKAENIFFSTSTQIEHLQPVLDSEPLPTVHRIKNYTIILSQPLRHGFKWNDNRKAVVEWQVHLYNFGHGKISFFFFG